MSGVKHTPWERLVGYAEPGHPIYKPGTEVIRIVEKRAHGQTEFVKVALVDSGQANARLIAAAPDLLEALVGLVDRDLTYDGPCIVIPAKSHVDAISIVRRARNAIARARGEQDGGGE